MRRRGGVAFSWGVSFSVEGVKISVVLRGHAGGGEGDTIAVVGGEVELCGLAVGGDAEIPHGGSPIRVLPIGKGIQPQKGAVLLQVGGVRDKVGGILAVLVVEIDRVSALVRIRFNAKLL